VEACPEPCFDGGQRDIVTHGSNNASPLDQPYGLLARYSQTLDLGSFIGCQGLQMNPLGHDGLLSSHLGQEDYTTF
jgi:hypothetical protein